MNQRRWIDARCVQVRALLLASVVLLGSAAAGAAPPNFVVILADDLGYGDLGCYGNTRNETPHLDRMAAAGLRMTDYHSNGPMCSPTRAALLTGCYQQRFGKRLDGALGPDPAPTNGLPPEAITLAELLKQKGYATGIFGKWHLGRHPRLLPTRQGFDEYVGLTTGDGDHHTRISRGGEEDWWHNETLVAEEGYTADLITQHSVDFLRRHREEPFFLYIPHLAIHFPWQGPDDPPHRQKGTDYGDDKWGIIPDRSNVAPHVKAMIARLDVSVGKVMDALEELGLAQNTLVVFTSDNGGYISYSGGFENISSNGPLRGQKSTLYEGGMRVPAIFYWPDRIAPGVSTETVLSMDLFPTIARLAGVDISDLRIDGTDVGPLLFARAPVPARTLFWRGGAERAVRQGPWKLREDKNGVELYNLDADLGETQDLAAEHPERVRELRTAWATWEADVNASAAPFEDKAP